MTGKIIPHHGDYTARTRLNFGAVMNAAQPIMP
jgi:hypothetical protein